MPSMMDWRRRAAQLFGRQPRTVFTDAEWRTACERVGLSWEDLDAHLEVAMEVAGRVECADCGRPAEFEPLWVALAVKCFVDPELKAENARAALVTCAVDRGWGVVRGSKYRWQVKCPEHAGQDEKAFAEQWATTMRVMLLGLSSKN